jgi:integrase
MPKKRKPKYALHKPSGQARVRIDGRDYYLGAYGTPESRERYDDLIAEWFAKQGDVSNYTLTIDGLTILYMRHAEQYYRKNGEPTTEVCNIRVALRPLIQFFGTDRVRDFGPLKLKAVRQYFIDAGYCRTNINSTIGRIKRMFRWGVECEYVPPSIHTALMAVAGLRSGRTEARESKPVRPVAEGTVNDTLPCLNPTVAAMVRLQVLTGARPGEVCRMRPCDITFGTNGVWVYRPESHKTEHHGKERRIYIGPEGQEVLRLFLDRKPEAFCFSPAESEAIRNAERRENRTTPMTPSQTGRKSKAHRGSPPKDHYTKDSYRRAIVRACRKAGVESWSPNRLRHSRATIIRERYGIEAAQVVLGHSDPKTTEIYAERDFEMAARIMREIG